MRRRREETPISLFSFQDIITCLTGIMIVVVLVILLQLVECTAAAAAGVSRLPEYRLLQERLAAVTAEAAELRERVNAARARRAERPPEDLETLRRRITEEEGKTAAAAREREKHEELATAAEKEGRDAAAKMKTLREHQRAAREREDRVRRAETELDALRREKEEAAKEAAKRQRRLRFEFSGANRLAPVLVECHDWGFRAKIHPDGAPVSFGGPGGKLAGQVSALQRWLRELGGWDRRYPVLLFHAGALAEYERILSAVRAVAGANAHLGMELVHDGEECF